MSYRYLLYGLTLAGVLVATGSVQAAQGSKNRDPHTCTGGPNAGLACTADDQCPQSKCEVNYLSGPGTTFSAELTIMVDDDVSSLCLLENVLNRLTEEAEDWAESGTRKIGQMNVERRGAPLRKGEGRRGKAEESAP